MSRVGTNNGPIGREIQPGVSMVRALWWKGFMQKGRLSFEFTVKSGNVRAVYTESWNVYKWQLSLPIKRIEFCK